MRFVVMLSAVLWVSCGPPPESGGAGGGGGSDTGQGGGDGAGGGDPGQRQPPTLQLALAPAVVQVGEAMTIALATTDFVIGRTGHAHYYFDGHEQQYQAAYDSEIVVNPPSAGQRTVTVELVTNAHKSLNPRVRVTASFTVL